MLTDTALRNLKPKSKIYKASDRDGMYVTVSPTGTVTFRYDYRLNGRRETLTIGRYGPAGISLALAREKLIDAKKAVAQGKSPALEKQREKRRLTAAKTFGEMTGKWLAGARMADSTKAMRKSIVDRDILPAFENRQLNEIASDDLRALCHKVKERGAQPQGRPRPLRGAIRADLWRSGRCHDTDRAHAGGVCRWRSWFQEGKAGGSQTRDEMMIGRRPLGLYTVSRFAERQYYLLIRLPEKILTLSED